MLTLCKANHENIITFCCSFITFCTSSICGQTINLTCYYICLQYHILLCNKLQQKVIIITFCSQMDDLRKIIFEKVITFCCSVTTFCNSSICKQNVTIITFWGSCYDILLQYYITDSMPSFSMYFNI